MVGIFLNNEMGQTIEKIPEASKLKSE